MAGPYTRNIALDLILTLLTCGLFNIYVQYCQIQSLNRMLGHEKYSFGLWLILVVVTFGLYQIYHEYRQAVDIERLTGKTNSNLALISVALTCFALHPVCDAIQQSYINEHFGSSSL